MNLNQLPRWATSFQYRKNNAYIMGLCLTYRVNLKLSLRQTVHAELAADETYIKIKGIKAYVWLIMDKVPRHQNL